MPSYRVSVDCVAVVYNVTANNPEEAVAKAAHQIEFGSHPDNMGITTCDWDEDGYTVELESEEEAGEDA